MSDIQFTIDQTRFRYRVGGLLIHEGKLLAITNPEEKVAYTLGGAVQIGETAEEALKREIWEEIGMTLSSSRLLFVHENFFEGRLGPIHEIGLFFEIQVLEDPSKAKALGLTNDGIHESIVWLDIEHPSIPVVPEIVLQEAKTLTKGVRHFLSV
ncbi:MAG: NUDIX domain-containing protein [Candidatus Izemoplasmatales bacterium]|nr:NUDIX domain-containing protein [Candidatus Izemoplasmatales bacterium]